LLLPIKVEVVIEELARHRCTGDDGSPLFVVEYRHVFTSRDEAGTRRHLGAAWLTLLDGEPVRYIDPRTFEVVATGELVTHDKARCRCERSALIQVFDRTGERLALGG